MRKAQRVILVDDSDLDLDHLSDLLEPFLDKWTISGKFSSSSAALAYLQTDKPDLMIVDINLDEMSGFDVVSTTKGSNIPVIFVTSFEEFALKAFEFLAIDYLLKPVTAERLQRALDKLNVYDEVSFSQRLDMLKEMLQPSPKDRPKFTRVIINNQHAVEVLNLDSIKWCEAKGPYTTFFQVDGRQVVATKPLKYYQVLLEQNGFFRLHRSYLINLGQVKTIDKANLTIRLHTGEALPITPDRLSIFIDEFKKAIEGLQV